MSVRYCLYQMLLHSILVISIIFLPSCVCQAGNDNERKVTGYLGEQVVLKLDVKPTQKLTSIQWSIYKNVTLIALFQHGVLIRYKNGFDVNTTSGDLIIKNLTANDALKYRVDLEINDEDQRTIYVQLSVQDQISKPNITLLHSFLDAEKCVISLKCSSLSNKIFLSWKHEHEFTEHFSSDCPNVTRESVMWTSLRTNRPVSFTCIATDGNRSESRKWSGKCPEPVYTPCTSRGTGAAIVFTGLLMIIFCLCCKGCLYGQCTREDETTSPLTKQEKQANKRASEKPFGKKFILFLFCVMVQKGSMFCP
ncbi:hypothetical protein KOW79_006711 [Hemibagrus wyckioides]|uniref:Ig-like domain-containing protein n=1 Tax=Hemibagrus wyckioides TaxID=337641 RepID=A0A9D3NXS8_9TELE|nr:hypothetical protein KOW79_006711 [Hemibagrus wyckioides]